MVVVPATDNVNSCQLCNKTSEKGNSICNECLAQEDDGFESDIKIKFEGKRGSKLSGKPFGTKMEPLKIEDDVYVKVEDDVKVEQDLEDDIIHKPSMARVMSASEVPVLIKLEDGRQALMINGTLTSIRNQTQLKAG